MESTSAPLSPATEPAWLVAREVAFRHPGSRAEVLHGVSFSSSCRSVALVGRNASGKSSLLALIAGRRRVTRGELWVEGLPAGDRSLAARLGYASQRPELDPDMTVDEHFELIGALYRVGRELLGARGRDLCARFSLAEVSARRAATLSGGQRRRLHLALSLVCEPSIWVADEPEAGLDAPGCERLWELVCERSEAGRRSVLAVHDLAAVCAHVEQVVALERGRVALCQRVDDGAGAAAELRDRLSAFVSRLHEPAARVAGAGGGAGA